VRQSFFLGEGALSALALEENVRHTPGVAAHGWPRAAIEQVYPTELPVGYTFVLFIDDPPTDVAVAPHSLSVVISTAEVNGNAVASSCAPTERALSGLVARSPAQSLADSIATGNLDVAMLVVETNSRDKALDDCVCFLKCHRSCPHQVPKTAAFAGPPGVNIAQSAQPTAQLWEQEYGNIIANFTEAVFDTACRSGSSAAAQAAGVSCCDGTQLRDKLIRSHTDAWLSAALSASGKTKADQLGWLQKHIISWIRKQCKDSQPKLSSRVSARAKLVTALFGHWGRTKRTPSGDRCGQERVEVPWVNAKGEPTGLTSAINDAHFPAQILRRAAPSMEKKLKLGRLWVVQYDYDPRDGELFEPCEWVAESLMRDPLSVAVRHDPVAAVVDEDCAPPPKKTKRTTKKKKTAGPAAVVVAGDGLSDDACPNRGNPHHTCTEFCRTTYGQRLGGPKKAAGDDGATTIEAQPSAGVEPAAVATPAIAVKDHQRSSEWTTAPELQSRMMIDTDTGAVTHIVPAEVHADDKVGPGRLSFTHVWLRHARV
jgi:hypothetical protein